jgi:ABC-type phosphate/phosphonate transport system substrate-binding protein
LASLANVSQRRPPSGSALTLRFAVSIDEAPVSQAIECAPFLRHLETEMEKLLHRQVFVDLWLYKTRHWVSPGVGRAEVDIQKLSALTYLRLKQAGTNLIPIVQQDQDHREGVIFARADSAITTLNDIRGHSMAFAHTNSVVSSFAKVILARAGICTNDLAAHQNFESSEYREYKHPRTGEYSRPDGPSEADDYAHKEVLEQVLARSFDVGVAPDRRFERQKHRGRGLVELARFEVPGDVFVARADFDVNIVSAFQKAVASLDGKRNKNHRKLLSSLSGSLNGLVPIDDRSFDNVRGAFQDELARFECRGTSSPPASSSAPVRSP